MKKLLLHVQTFGIALLFPTLVSAQVMPQPVKIDPIYVGMDSDGIGVRLVNADLVDGRYPGTTYLLGTGDIRAISRHAFFDCAKGTVVKIHKLYENKTIKVNEKPRSDAFKVMLQVACINQRDGI